MQSATPAAEEEFVYIDELTIGEPLEQPDYVIDSLQYSAGSYVLQRDRLFVTVTGSNRGQNYALPDDFKVSLWLTPSVQRNDGEGEADDRFLTDDFIALGDLEQFQELDGTTRFTYQASLVLPDSVPEGQLSLGCARRLRGRCRVFGQCF